MLSYPRKVFNRHFSLARSVSVVLSVVLFLVTSAEAQQDTLRGTKPTLADSIAAQAAWAESDTGRMMPGYGDLSRYDNPGMCLAAITGVQNAIWRRGQPDTLPRYTGSDTIPTAAREIGRACLAHMSPENVDSAQLYDLMAAAIKAGDTALARRAAVYHAAKITGGAREQGYVLFDAMQHGFASRPSQVEWAESLFRHIVTLGPDALDPMRDAFSLRSQIAWTRFDTATLFRIDHDRDTIFKRLIAEGVVEDSSDLGVIYMDSISVVRHQRSPGFRDEMERIGHRYVEMYSGSDLGRIMAMGSLEGIMGTARILGTSAPPPFKMFSHYPASAPLGPAPGRVTVVGYIEGLGEGVMEPYLATLRRLHEKYHDSGLDIILIAQTQGFAWRSPPLDTAEEAKLIGWYYREHLKLPFTIFVAVADFGRLSDGRITRKPSRSFPQIGVYRYWRPHWGYIVARDGTIADQINRTRRVHESEARLEAIIRRELDIQSHAQKP